MSLSKEEKTIQRRLSILSAACFVTGLVFPPAAIIGGAVLAGQAGRAYRTRHTGDNEKSQDSSNSQYNQRTQSYEPYVMPESPETAISRRSAEIGKNTLETISRNVMYSAIAKQAEGAAEQYLSSMRELNPDRIARSSGINVTFNQKQNQGLRRLIFGPGDVGYELNINLINVDE